MTFLNVVEIESALIALNAAHPAITQLISLPHVTAEGRRSHALLIGAPGPRCPRPGVLFISGAHGRERGGPDILVNLATDILEAYSAGSGIAYGGKTFSAEDVASIVARIDLIVFPNVNPDGRHHSQTVTPDWRRNRNPAMSGGNPARVGVDVNRNFDFLWDFPVAFSPAANPDSIASTDPANEMYHGPAPFSEAESKNVRWLVERYGQIGWFVDVHSSGGDILYSWGDDENQSVDPSRNFRNPAWNKRRGVAGDEYGEYIPASDHAIAKAAAIVMRDANIAVRGEPYVAAQSFFLPGWGTYPTSGASDDWCFSRAFLDAGHGTIYAFTYEFNVVKTFYPTWPEMVEIIKDVDAGLLALCLHVRPGRLAMLWCVVRAWAYRLWRRVRPPDLWGPYGPLARLARAVARVAAAVVHRVGSVLRRVARVAASILRRRQ